MVTALPCKSWPHSLGHLFDKQQNSWLTLETKTYAKTTKCFVVGVGSKVSENADFEWRISTSLAERCLMFNLNITQIRCYILMKMILKRYINLDNESYISSFMCKTVLFHCIASKPSNIWKECNLINCLCYCIYTLNQCVLCGNCPHFIVHGNNVMAGKFSAKVRHELLERMSNLIPCDEILLSQIQCDDLGLRLQIKLNEFSVGHHEFYNPEDYTNLITAKLFMCIPENISGSHNSQMHSTKDESFETLLQIVLNFTRYYRDGNILEKTACRLLAPLYCTSIGSLIASENIQINNTVSPQALAWLEAGQDSDVASSRLKLASIMYCTGDMETTACILNDVEEQYNTEVTEPVCGCYSSAKPYIKIGFCQLSCLYGEERVKDIVALCVRFYPWEINCVPHELQYELFRSTQEDLEHRSINDLWMDCAVVDSLPYLYFLQYKTYGNLQRPVEQQQALTKLMWVNETEPNFRHRETALNLLGQCMEQENRPIDALQYYMLSLRHRERNNAAKIHICRCLANTIS
ncbi:uncharacterized protein LOC128557818 [Mercenaria mercenaria]|uniref:uncharacterized protein LOC128557818 n=1 Tax=Mercenaria mercenaria TaxID=6596 RepID=UPI00234E7DD1|nr:uncharacterized protein LOC128557818 [Mercenaria mercenaria]